MKRILLFAGLFTLCSIVALGQPSNPSIVTVSADPSGTVACTLPWRYSTASGTGWYPGSPSGGSCTWTQFGATGSGGPPTGAAGGVLSGTYPNPGLAASLPLPNGTTATTQTQLDGTTKVATTAYTDTAVANAVAGVNPAVAVLAASTANVTGTYVQVGGGIGDTFTVTATGAFTLDGIAINTIGQRILLKNQSTASQNGVYTATVVGAVAVSPIFTRALDYDTPSDVNNTGTIPVQSGTVNTTTSWLLTSQVVSIGSAGSSLTYAQFSNSPAKTVSWRTSIGACSSGPCNATLTIPNGGFADTSYTLVCTPSAPVVSPTGYNLTFWIQNKTATTAVFVYFSNSTAWPSTGFAECIAIHD